MEKMKIAAGCSETVKTKYERGHPYGYCIIQVYDDTRNGRKDQGKPRAEYKVNEK